MAVKRPKLSPSTINLFQDCPRCFWLQMARGIKRPRGIFPSLPIGMDSILKRYYDRFRKGDALPPLIAGRIPGRLAPEYPKSLSIAPEGEYDLTGKLDDLLLLPDGRYAPLDHKTRASPPKEVHASYQTQMDIYAWLLAENGFPASEEAFLIYYYPLEGDLHDGFPFGVTVETLRTSIERAKRAFANAVECLRQGLPALNGKCEYCLWARESHAL